MTDSGYFTLNYKQKNITWTENSPLENKQIDIILRRNEINERNIFYSHQNLAQWHAPVWYYHSIGNTVDN